MDSESEKKAEAAFVSAVRVTESLMGRGNSGADKELARVLAKNILREELGAFEDPLKAIEPYDLDSKTANSLLTHARQDIAMVYSLVSRANEQLYQVIAMVRVLTWLVLLNLVATISIILLGFL
jgi:hypothetical protein